MRARRSTTLLAACAMLLVAAAAADAARYEYDALNRVTKVTYANGHSVSYRYDPAGNITSVITVGRSSASASSRLGPGSPVGAHDRYSFRASNGETVTLRFEADPPQAGLGKYVVMTVLGRAGKAGKDRLDGDDPTVVKNDVVGAIPAELTVVVPFDGEFTVHVKHVGPPEFRYSGPYRLTLEASPEACASLDKEH